MNKPSKFRQITALAALVVTATLVTACGSAGPTEEFAADYAVTPNTELVIENGNGSTTVVTDNSANLAHVQATLQGADNIEFSVTESPGQLKIVATGDTNGWFRPNPMADIEVKVPIGIQVTVHSGNGKVDVTGTQASVHVTTGNGAINLDAAAGEIVATSGNGKVTISNSRGSFTARTGNGSVEIGAVLLAGGENSLSSGNGRISVRLLEAADVSIDAETDNGKIESSLVFASTDHVGTRRIVGIAGGGNASLRIRSGNGSIDLSEG